MTTWLQKLSAISNPPNMPSVYYAQCLNRLAYFIQVAQSIKVDNKLLLEDMLNRSERYDVEDCLSHIPEIIKLFASLSSDINYAVKFGEITSLKYTVDNYSQQRINRKLDFVLAGKPGLQKVLEQVSQFWDAEYGDQQVEIGKLKQAIRSLTVLESAKLWYQGYIRNTEAMFNLRNRAIEYDHGFSSDKGRVSMPPHEATEILYHATTALGQVLKDGLKTRDELGIGGALGGGPSDLISFTSDAKIAKAIAWVLKQATLIAQGKFGEKELYVLCKKLGKEPDDVVRYADTSVNKKDLKKWLFSALRYLMASQSKIYDPFLAFVSVEDFAKNDINNIGVVKAKVDMSKVKEYLPAMEEYRVPKEAILEVSKA